MNRVVGQVSLVVSLLLSAAALAGCGALRSYYYDQGPPGYASPQSMPPWEAASGIYQRREYYYYPQARIYFDLKKEVYFFYDEGQWQVSSHLPAHLRLPKGYVTLKMQEEEPYRWQEDVEKAYPPE